MYQLPWSIIGEKGIKRKPSRPCGRDYVKVGREAALPRRMLRFANFDATPPLREGTVAVGTVKG